MASDTGLPGRRARAKEDKRHRITDAARVLFAEHGAAAVTTQQIADRADVAIGTLYLYVATKAELLILVQNQKFAAATDTGLAAVAAADGDTADRVLALVGPVVGCLREHPENGRAYLHELVFGDPREPHRAAGLAVSLRLEDGLTRVLSRDPAIGTADSATLARVITAILHLTTTATVHLQGSPTEILQLIRQQVTAVLGTVHARPDLRSGKGSGPALPADSAGASVDPCQGP